MMKIAAAVSEPVRDASVNCWAQEVQLTLLPHCASVHTLHSLSTRRTATCKGHSLSGRASSGFNAQAEK